MAVITAQQLRRWSAAVLLITFAPYAVAAPEGETSPSPKLSGQRVVDIAGTRHHLGQDGRVKGSVFVFLSTECPICQQYVPELNRLAKQSADRSIPFFGVVSDPVQLRSDVAAFQKAYRVEFPILFDESGDIARTLRPTHTPEAFLIDGQDRVLYRGRIDDLYPKIGQRQLTATSHELASAVDSICNGSSISASRTEPVGCRFERHSSPSTDEKVTFTRHIAPIMYANCTECHRPGEVAPFSLISYEDASKRADWLAEVIDKGSMPPWRAAEGYGHFLEERRLSATQKELIAKWAATGASKGNEADLPVLPEYPNGWQLGEPDLVLEAPHSVTTPAEGPDLFHHFVVPLNLPEDVDAVAIEFRPGNPRAVHHAIVFLDQSGDGRSRDEKTPEPGFTTSSGTAIALAGVLNIWAPGVTARPLPEGVGIRLPKKTGDILVQLHLHPTGKEEVDRSKVGIYFAKKPVTRHIMERPFVYGPLMIDIAPGDRAKEFAASIKVPVDMTLIGVLPHMHLIGREMKVWAELPSRKIEPLVWIKDWNFYWQDQYIYQQPIRIPKDSVIHVTGVYDNSEGNPLNPSHPPKRILLGEESTDEMCLALFQTVVEKQSDSLTLRNSVLFNAMAQISDKKVPLDVRNHTARALRQTASREFLGLLRDPPREISK